MTYEIFCLIHIIYSFFVENSIRFQIISCRELTVKREEIRYKSTLEGLVIKRRNASSLEFQENHRSFSKNEISHAPIHFPSDLRRRRFIFAMKFTEKTQVPVARPPLIRIPFFFTRKLLLKKRKEKNEIYFFP